MFEFFFIYSYQDSFTSLKLSPHVSEHCIINLVSARYFSCPGVSKNSIISSLPFFNSNVLEAIDTPFVLQTLLSKRLSITLFIKDVFEPIPLSPRRTTL